MLYYTRHVHAEIKICLLASLVWQSSGDVDVEGVVSLRVNSSVHGGGGEAEELEVRFGTSPSRSHQVTAGSLLECSYQFPEKEQVDAILGHMMNKLTKVFVRAHDIFADEDAARRGADTRFRVVDEKKAKFFEHIYHNMTQDYSKLYQWTRERVGRAGRDPCTHQPEVEGMWRALLDSSLATFRKAALQTVAEQLRVLRSNERTKNRLSQYLMRELAKIRSDQLLLLCDNFQLCFNDLQT